MPPSTAQLAEENNGITRSRCPENAYSLASVEVAPVWVLSSSLWNAPILKRLWRCVAMALGSRVASRSWLIEGDAVSITDSLFARIKTSISCGASAAGGSTSRALDDAALFRGLFAIRLLDTFQCSLFPDGVKIGRRLWQTRDVGASFGLWSSALWPWSIRQIWKEWIWLGVVR